MGHNELFKKLCSPSSLRTGWHLARLDSQNAFLADSFGHSDFAADLEPRLRFLSEEIQNERYRPRYLTDIDIPKSGLSVRPGNILPIEESVVLHTAVALMAPRLDKRLAPEVKSYRLHPEWERRAARRKSLFHDHERTLPFLKNRTIRRLDPIESWYQAWPDFDKARTKAVLEDGFGYRTKTDITAYFENIDLRLLETQLRSMLPDDDALISLVFTILGTWTRTTSNGVPVGRGIPQGNSVSSFLGNLYLIPLDREIAAFCKKRKAVWFRYVDDVDIYTRSEGDARRAVFAVNEALRSLHLNLQGSKTSIASGVELLRAHDKGDSLAIDSTWNSIQRVDCRARKNQKAVTAHLRPIHGVASRFRSGLPDSVGQLSGKESRTFRRLLTVYGRCGRPRLKDAALEVLKTGPDLRLLEKSLRYLSQMPYSLHDETAKSLLEILESDLLPIPFQAAKVLETLRQLHPTRPSGLAARIKQFGLASGRRWPVRARTLEAVATFPYRRDHAYSVGTKSLKDPHSWCRRSACLLFVRGPVEAVRREVRELAYHPDPDVNRVGLFWRRSLSQRERALSEIAQMKSVRTDYALVQNLPRLWLLRCNPDVDVARSLHQLLLSLRTNSKKLLWHRDRLVTATSWAVTASEAT